MNPAAPPDHLHLDLTWQEPIPPAGLQAAMALMDSGKLHRYGETGAKPGAAAALEADFAAELGSPYCVAMNSCGSTMFAALRCSGVRPGDKVLSNCFTLAPVPGAIAHAGAVPVLVDVTEDLVIDLDDLRRKAAASGATTLLLSHMRGHICDMDALTSVCAEFGHHADLVAGEVHDIVFVVIGAAMAKREQGGRLADGARAKARARAPLGAHVVGHADHGHVGVNGVPVHAGGGFGKSSVADKGQVQATALVGIFRHGAGG